MRPILLGQKIQHHKRLRSTQDVALGMAKSDPNVMNGTMVVAETQSNGRGRQNRRWISPPGGLWFSIILKPCLHPSRSALINFINILAVCEAIEIRTCLKCKVKWPNDILINGRKVCGIILDLATKSDYIQYSVVGIGLNVNVDIQNIIQCMEADSEAGISITSLKMERSGRFVNRRFLLKSFLERLNYYFNSFGQDKKIPEVLRRISRRLEGMGETINISQTNCFLTGKLIGVCSEGSLLIRKTDGSISKIPAHNTYH